MYHITRLIHVHLCLHYAHAHTYMHTYVSMIFYLYIQQRSLLAYSHILSLTLRAYFYTLSHMYVCMYALMYILISRNKKRTLGSNHFSCIITSVSFFLSLYILCKISSNSSSSFFITHSFTLHFCKIYLYPYYKVNYYL